MPTLNWIGKDAVVDHPKVKCWVRNLEGRPRHSFWLQTSTDRWSDDDSKEKRAVGQVWESKSNNVCLFVMPKGPDWNAILAKLG